MKKKVYSVVTEVSENETVVKNFLTEKEARAYLLKIAVAELTAAKEMGKIVSFDVNAKTALAADGYCVVWNDDMFTYHMCGEYEEDHYYTQVYEDEIEMPYMFLIADGYSIETEYFATIDAAKEKMKNYYNELVSSCGDGFEEGNEFYDMSYLSDNEALLYANGNDVYCMKIVSAVKED